MAKWRHLVRMHLHLPELRGLRAERIVEEIAGQLADLYDEARRNGATRAEVERLALDHWGGGKSLPEVLRMRSIGTRCRPWSVGSITL